MNIEDIDIRKSVINNLKNGTDEDLRSTITDAMTIKEEKILPGLGVLFELYWRNASEDDRNRVVSTISNNLKQ